MNTRSLFTLACAAALAIGAALLSASAMAAAADTLAPEPGERLAFTLSARGVQVYECRAGADGAAAAWSFVAPEAELFDADGRAAGTHGAGPHWQARDGSRITGAVKRRADAPQHGAIPWLLLVAHGRSSSGLFGDVTSIQRVNTRGGSAPVGACSSPGLVLRVPYAADYHFFHATAIDTRSQP